MWSTFGRSPTKRFAEHGKSALGCLTGGLVLNHIPVLHENSIYYSNDVRHNPVRGRSECGKSPVQDDEAPFGQNCTGLIAKGRWNALDEIEQAVATRRDMNAMLDVVGSPITPSSFVVTLIEEPGTTALFFDSIA
jgi:hypothetical protein